MVTLVQSTLFLLTLVTHLQHLNVFQVYTHGEHLRSAVTSKPIIRNRQEDNSTAN